MACVRERARSNSHLANVSAPNGQPSARRAIMAPPSRSSPEGVRPGPRPRRPSTASVGAAWPASGRRDVPSQVRSAAMPGAAACISACVGPGASGAIGRPATRAGIADAKPSAGAHRSASSVARPADNTRGSQSAGGVAGRQTPAFAREIPSRPPKRSVVPSHSAALPGETPCSSQFRPAGRAASTFRGPAPNDTGPMQTRAPLGARQYTLRRKTASTLQTPEGASAARAFLPRRMAGKVSVLEVRAAADGDDVRPGAGIVRRNVVSRSSARGGTWHSRTACRALRATAAV